MYGFRELLLEKLRQDLVGPGSDREQISDPPVTRYAVGVLFPRDAGLVDAEQDVDTPDGDDDAGFGDPPVALANARYPSSMGLTFAVDLSRADSLRIHPSAARYEPDGDPATASSWRRIPCEIDPVTVAVDEPSIGRVDLGEGLELFYRVRNRDADD